MLQYIYTSPFPLTQASSSRRNLGIDTDIGGQSSFLACLLCLRAADAANAADAADAADAATWEVSASVFLITQI